MTFHCSVIPNHGMYQYDSKLEKYQLVIFLPPKFLTSCEKNYSKGLAVPYLLTTFPGFQLVESFARGQEMTAGKFFSIFYFCSLV